MRRASKLGKALRGMDAAVLRATDGTKDILQLSADRRSCGLRMRRRAQDPTALPCYTLCASGIVEAAELRAFVRPSKQQKKIEPASVCALRARDQQAFEWTVPVCGV